MNNKNKTRMLISKLRNWSKNPRSISKLSFTRLKKQIKELGEYKPLIVTPDGEVIGGNMRLLAYKELGFKDVWVNIIKPKNEKHKIQIALSDNDRAGFYEEDRLIELVENFDIKLDDFSIDLKESIVMTDFVDKYNPNEKDIDEHIHVDNECPKCGYKW